MLSTDQFEQSIQRLEQALWSDRHDFDSLLADYQALFREQEILLADRYHFIISIPVADRPRHLRQCLESIYRQRTCFGYGGTITVVIAEDSREQDNIDQHIALATEYNNRGLTVIHFGQDEQYELLQSIPEDNRKQLGHILTTQPRDRFYLKGQAANRNLSILKCLRLTKDPARTLYYFVDSDESFCVNRAKPSGDEAVNAVNYFHYIDRAFRSGNIDVLTGKMVGDPPVSPSVMAGNFLDDITAFFVELAEMHGSTECGFHGMATTGRRSSGAIYHDMADKFGFDNRNTSFPCRCPLQGKHDVTDCLSTIASRLSAFFFGEHLTRRTVFEYDAGFTELSPARTVYPGNTITSHAGLKYAIPFGHLRLRMSGPTTGRLIAAEIGDRFASINLPHLHRRITGNELDNAFRPGVELVANGQSNTIDLSDEFERQFFGDLMLFATEALVKQADVSKPFERNAVERIMDETEQDLLARYRQKHEAVRQKNRQLENLVFNSGHWWLNEPGPADALQQIRAFISNIDHNFGEQSPAWQQIQSPGHRAKRKQQLTGALINYRTERDAWDGLFE